MEDTSPRSDSGGRTGQLLLEDYVGQPATHAAQALRRAGLRAAMERTFGYEPGLYGLVAQQDPLAGANVTRNSLVTLYIAAPADGESGAQAQVAPDEPEGEVEVEVEQPERQPDPITEAHWQNPSEEELLERASESFAAAQQQRRWRERSWGGARLARSRLGRIVTAAAALWALVAVIAAFESHPAIHATARDRVTSRLAPSGTMTTPTPNHQLPVTRHTPARDATRPSPRATGERSRPAAHSIPGSAHLVGPESSPTPASPVASRAPAAPAGAEQEFSFEDP